MLKPALIALSLFAATGVYANAAEEFRLVTTSDEVAVMASTTVTGPQNARRMTEILVRRVRSDTGADAYVLQTTVDCTTGTLSIGDVQVYADNKLLREIPARPDNSSQPEESSVAGQVLRYGCTGEVGVKDATQVSGVNAAIAYGRQAQGLSD